MNNFEFVEVSAENKKTDAKAGGNIAGGARKKLEKDWGVPSRQKIILKH